MSFLQDRGVKEDELQSILNYLLTMHEVKIIYRKTNTENISSKALMAKLAKFTS